MCTFASDQDESTLHIERIYKDKTFWDECLAKAKHFFMTCLLPELLGKWYTRPTVPQCDSSQCEQSSSSDQSNNMGQLQQIQQNQGTFCYCHSPDTGTTVADLGGFQGFHGTPLLASVMIEGYGSLAFNKTQLIRL